VGFLAISAGSVISLLIPSFGHSQVLYLVQGEPVRLGPLVIGLSGLLGLAALNLAGMLATRRFQYWVTFALIASVVAFVVTSLLRSDPTNLLPLFSSNSSEASFAGFLAVLGTTPFWLAGFNVVPQALQETCRNADSRTAGRVIIASILAAAVFKGSVIIATAITSPRSEVLHSAFPLSLAFTRAFSSARMGQAVTVVALAALLSCWNAVFFTTCRILTSMGERALLPSHFSRLTKRAAASPSALALTFVVGLLLTLGGRPLVQPIISAGGTCFGLLFLLTCVVDWRESRARSSNHGWQRAGNLFVAGAGVFLSAVMILLSLDIFGAIKSQRLPISWLMLLGLLVATSAAAIRRLGHDRAFTESSKPSS
jgi:amino acid transporter